MISAASSSTARCTAPPSLLELGENMAYGRRDTNDGPWRYCARCDRKMLINVELGWQRGKLICFQYCWDNKLIGDREIFMDRVLSDGKEELAPVQKLREPDLEETDDDILI